MPHGRTLMEFKYCCHVVASLGLALLDVSLLARDSVICKQGCGGLSHMALIVAHRQQVSRAPVRSFLLPIGEKVARSAG
jgi:hypothetical protein